MKRAIGLALAVLILLGLIAGVEFAVVHRLLSRWPQSQMPALAFLFGASVVGLLTLWLRALARGRRRVHRFESLLALTPTQFEQEVAGLLVKLGYRDVKRVGGAGDLGADLTCRDRRGRYIVVQCKRYAPGNRVGSRDLQSFIGMITVHHGADRGIFVSTSAFTAPAIQLAERHNIELLDGAALASLVRH